MTVVRDEALADLGEVFGQRTANASRGSCDQNDPTRLCYPASVSSPGHRAAPTAETLAFPPRESRRKSRPGRRCGRSLQSSALSSRAPAAFRVPMLAEYASTRFQRNVLFRIAAAGPAIDGSGQEPGSVTGNPDHHSPGQATPGPSGAFLLVLAVPCRCFFPPQGPPFLV